MADIIMKAVHVNQMLEISDCVTACIVFYFAEQPAKNYFIILYLNQKPESFCSLLHQHFLYYNHQYSFIVISWLVHSLFLQYLPP